MLTGPPGGHTLVVQPSVVALEAMGLEWPSEKPRIEAVEEPRKPAPFTSPHTGWFPTSSIVAGSLRSLPELQETSLLHKQSALGIGDTGREVKLEPKCKHRTSDLRQLPGMAHFITSVPSKPGSSPGVNTGSETALPGTQEQLRAQRWCHRKQVAACAMEKPPLNEACGVQHGEGRGHSSEELCFLHLCFAHLSFFLNESKESRQEKVLNLTDRKGCESRSPCGMSVYPPPASEQRRHRPRKAELWEVGEEEEEEEGEEEEGEMEEGEEEKEEEGEEEEEEEEEMEEEEEEMEEEEEEEEIEEEEEVEEEEMEEEMEEEVEEMRKKKRRRR
ncbi:hypothetical protein H920_11691 [Fukomys damarensis]|uniref:Uncharacterized protein n=1 Tax=Fukomys damarensis TaxID=885580 RepID=A0A091DVU4_FUKDA|nr:hypothetical protein H920_11691 [Fukomys damarensis]